MVYQCGSHIYPPSRRCFTLKGYSVKVLIKADMLDYYSVSGCYILKPWSYSIWEIIQGNGHYLTYVAQRHSSETPTKNGSTRRLRRWASKTHISRCLCRNECSSGRRTILKVSLLRSPGLHERAFVRIGPNVMPRLTLPIQRPVRSRRTHRDPSYVGNRHVSL